LSGSDLVVGKMLPASANFVLVSLSLIILPALCIPVAQRKDLEALLVQTSQGPVRGYKDVAADIFTFYGIPYATAPTGRDRYKVKCLIW
jgi:hypothetical protein